MRDGVRFVSTFLSGFVALAYRPCLQNISPCCRQFPTASSYGQVSKRSFPHLSNQVPNKNRSQFLFLSS